MTRSGFAQWFVPLLLVVASSTSGATEYRRVQGDTSVQALGEDIPGNSFNDLAESNGLQTGAIFGGSALSRQDSLAVNANGWSKVQSHIEGYAEVGHLRVESFVEALSSPVKPKLTVASGTSYATAEWGDIMHLLAPGGSFGTPVRLKIIVQLTGVGALERPSDATDRLFPTVNSLSQSFTLPIVGRIDHSCRDFAGCDENWAITLDLMQGPHYGLSSYLQVNADAGAWSYAGDDYGSFEQGLAMAQGRSRMFIEMLTPGASYTLDSGLMLAPVPEPTALALVLPGGLLVLFAARRRRARPAE